VRVRGGEIGVENFPVATHRSAPGFSAALGVGSLKPERVAEMMPQAFDLRLFLNELEKALVLRALGATSGAQAEAARRLGLSRSDLSYKLGKYGVRTSTE
jgi:transcriptional regulator with GAF, ATPase, and Fis domain